MHRRMEHSEERARSGPCGIGPLINEYCKAVTAIKKYVKSLVGRDRTINRTPKFKGKT